jgi:hypothetical protein
MQIKFYGGVSDMLEKLILSNIKNRIVNHDKIKKAKALKKLNKEKKKRMLITTFGKARYILSIWFGQWILFTCNTNFYNVQVKKAVEPLTQQPSKVIYLNNYR